jgi:hypothetical protein
MAHVVENWHQSRASFRRSQSHERDRPIPESVVEIDSRSASKQACKKWTLTRIEYFIPVILRSFPVIENFFPVIVLVVFAEKCLWMLGFRDFRP